MAMFRKYEKTFRLPSVLFETGKRELSSADQKKLLNGKITVEEKIDGANVGIIGTKPGEVFRTQKRGSLVGPSEHEQFNRFKAWTVGHADDFNSLPKGIIIYGEFMWATHHIFYNSLPDWFICFDIWDNCEYVSRLEKEEWCQQLNLQCVPLIYEGPVASITELLDLLPGKSEYSSDQEKEGIVVKNYKKQMRAKLVRPNFIKEVNEDGTHWMTKWDPRKVNKLQMGE